MLKPTGNQVSSLRDIHGVSALQRLRTIHAFSGFGDKSTKLWRFEQKRAGRNRFQGRKPHARMRRIFFAKKISTPHYAEKKYFAKKKTERLKTTFSAC
jgi:hypothetical protein